MAITSTSSYQTKGGGRVKLFHKHHRVGKVVVASRDINRFLAEMAKELEEGILYLVKKDEGVYKLFKEGK
jgi:hypothetical protein